MFDRLTSIFRSLIGSPPVETPPAEAPPAPTPPDPALQALLDFVSRTETGQNLVAQARDAKFIITFADGPTMKDEPSFSFVTYNKTVYINKSLPQDEQVLALSGELARALLAKEKLAPTLQHTALARIQMSRIVNGHMAAVKAQIANEFDHIGEPGPKAKLAARRPMVIAAYDRSKAAHPDAGSNGAAMAAAFVANYADKKNLASEEAREMTYLEELHKRTLNDKSVHPESILTDFNTLYLPYTGQEAREHKVSQALLSLLDYPVEYYKASMEARRRKLTNPEVRSLLPDGNTDLMKLTNAHGVSYVSTFFPDFMPTDAEHASVLPETAERIKALDEKRPLGFRQFSKPNSIPARDYLAASETPAPAAATTPEMRGPA